MLASQSSGAPFARIPGRRRWSSCPSRGRRRGAHVPGRSWHRCRRPGRRRGAGSLESGCRAVQESLPVPTAVRRRRQRGPSAGRRPAWCRRPRPQWSSSWSRLQRPAQPKSIQTTGKSLSSPGSRLRRGGRTPRPSSTRGRRSRPMRRPSRPRRNVLAGRRRAERPQWHARTTTSLAAMRRAVASGRRQNGVGRCAAPCA